MSKHLPLQLKKVIALAIYLAILLATILSFQGNAAPNWADIVAALPAFLPFIVLALLRDDRPLNWVLDGTVTSLEWVLDYVTGTLPKDPVGS